MNFPNTENTEKDLTLVFNQKEEEITALKEEKNSRTTKYAGYDQLMDVYNKKTGLIKLKKEIAKAIDSGKSLALCYLDIDNLQKINDEEGYCQGNNILRVVGNIIKQNIRKTDTVFRYGGDEVVIILPSAGIREAMNVCRRIDKSILDLNLPRPAVKVSMSRGIAEYNFDFHKTPEELIEEAYSKMNQERLTRKGYIVKIEDYRLL